MCNGDTLSEVVSPTPPVWLPRGLAVSAGDTIFTDSFSAVCLGAALRFASSGALNLCCDASAGARADSGFSCDAGAGSFELILRRTQRPVVVKSWKASDGFPDLCCWPARSAVRRHSKRDRYWGYASVRCALGQRRGQVSHRSSWLRRRELTMSLPAPRLTLSSSVMPELVVLSLSCDVRSGQSWSNRDEASDGFPDLCCWPARSAVRRRSKGDRCYVVQVYSVYSSVRCALGQRRSQVSHRSSWLRRRELTMSLAAPRLTLSSSVRPELSLLRAFFYASGGPLRASC